MIGIGLRIGARSGGALAQVAAMLAGKKGAYWDFAGNVFEDDAGTDPAEANDGVAVLSSSTYGTALPTWLQTSASARPTYQTSYATFDGDDRLIGGANNRAIFQQASQGVFGIKFQLSSLAAAAALCGWSLSASNSQRLVINITTTGAVQVLVRRADADGLTTVASTTGLITTGTDYVLIVTVDWATGGSGAVRAYINGGSDVVNGTLTGTGATDNTASQTSSLGANLGFTASTIGRIYKTFASNFLPTTAERATITTLLT